MAQFKLIQTWEENAHDYAAYLYCEKTGVDKLKYTANQELTSNLKTVETNDLSKNIKSRMINVDNISEICCRVEEEIFILDLNISNNEALVNVITNPPLSQNDLKLLNSYLKEYKGKNYEYANTPGIFAHKEIMNACLLSFKTLSYRVTLQNSNSFMVMPDSAKAILGDDLFQKLSQNPL